MRNTQILLTLVIMFLFMTSVYSQRTLTTSVRGRVVDAISGEGLIGATVKIGSGQVGVITDYDGAFIFPRLVGDIITLNITYIGYEPLLIKVVMDKAVLDLGLLKMEENSRLLDGVVIRASLEEKQKALNQQRSADNIKNVISSDLIGKFPDLNVAEALQRVPGVNIQRDKGEGSTISIRGTPLNFTTVQINGKQIPSVQQNGGRTESLDLISADQLSSMEITKVPTADMDGDAIGGTVNLKTPRAKSLDLGIRAETGIGYNDISNGLNATGRLRLDKRFFSMGEGSRGKLGVLAGGSLYNSNNSEHSTSAAWRGTPTVIGGESEVVMNQYQYRLTDNNRERIGATLTLDYEHNEHNKLVFNYMYNKREDNDLRNRLRFDIDTDRGAQYLSLDTIGGSGTRVRRDINAWDELKENQSFNLEGEHEWSTWKIDWSGFYTFSDRIFFSNRGDFASEGNDLVVVANNPEGIYGQAPNFTLSENNQSVYDPFLFNDFRRYEEDAETTEATNLVGKIDIIKYLKQSAQNSFYLKFGGKYKTQTNEKFRDNRVLRFNDPNDILNQNEIFLSSLSGTEPNNFLFSDYRFGPTIGRDEFQRYISENRRLLDESDDAWDALRLSLNDTYQAEENIYAVYAMIRMQLSDLMVLAGLRYENNTVNYDAFDVFRFGTNVESVPISGGNDFNFWLPNLHFKLNLDKYTALRLSAVFNYARPNFVDVVPFANLDVDAFTLNLGNPLLQPAKAFNLDLMYEHYFKSVGVISLGGFYKNIDKFQFNAIDPSLQTDFPGYPNTQGFQFSQEQNGENAEVAGIEFNFFNSLGFLPGLLKKFNIEGNYTYAYSNAFTQNRQDISLPGQAEHTFNSALSFDYKTFTARVSANYNGRFLNSVASTEENDFIQESRLQIDANLSVKYKKNWRLYVEGVNLTNEPTVRFQGNETRVARLAYFGWSVRTGISFRL